MLYIYLALFSALGFSISDLCSKYLFDNDVSNLQYLFWGHGILYITLSILAIIITSYLSIGYFTNNKKYLDVLRFPSGNKGGIIIVATLASFLGLLSLLYAFKISINIAYTSAIVSTVSLITLIINRVVLKKKIQLSGLVGIVLIISGVYFISRCQN